MKKNLWIKCHKNFLIKITWKIALKTVIFLTWTWRAGFFFDWERCIKLVIFLWLSTFVFYGDNFYNIHVNYIFDVLPPPQLHLHVFSPKSSSQATWINMKNLPFITLKTFNDTCALTKLFVMTVFMNCI